MNPVKIHRWSQGNGWSVADDCVASEEPLEIRVDGKSVSVVMRTPGNDEELALGFLVTEGIIRRREDVARTQLYPRNQDGNVMDVFLADGVTWDAKQLTRHVFAASSCGICGKASIAAIRRLFPKITTSVSMDPAKWLTMAHDLRIGQTTFDRTGGLHGAGWFTEDGKVHVIREDVGRHNAVDKVIGHQFKEGRFPMEKGVLLVSGRTSFEILQKALAAGIPVVAGVGAPSSLAVEFAQENGQILVGFVRDSRLNVYTTGSLQPSGSASPWDTNPGSTQKSGETPG